MGLGLQGLVDVLAAVVLGHLDHPTDAPTLHPVATSDRLLVITQRVALAFRL